MFINSNINTIMISSIPLAEKRFARIKELLDLCHTDLLERWLLPQLWQGKGSSACHGGPAHLQSWDMPDRASRFWVKSSRGGWPRQWVCCCVRLAGAGHQHIQVWNGQGAATGAFLGVRIFKLMADFQHSLMHISKSKVQKIKTLVTYAMFHVN